MIKHLIAILLTTSAAYSQTIKTLGYNTTNGKVAYSGSNTLTFTNPLGFSDAATTRTNLGLGWLALTNTNASNFRTAIGLGSLATNNTVPSGAAASNSILTADGAGSSSFVASKTVTVVKSSDQSRTNTSDMTITNNNDPELTQTVTAGDIYYIGVRLEITTGTNSGFNAGIFTGTNNVFSSTSQTVGTAMRHNLNVTGFYVSTGNPVAQITFGGNGITGAATRSAWTGNGIFRCATNGTLTVRWSQFVASNSATTLHAGSSFTLTKLN